MLHDRIPITVGWIDLPGQRVQRGDTSVKLTTKEVQILTLLVARKGQSVSYEELLREIWDTDLHSKAARQAVKRLRPKIEQDPKQPDHLLSDFGKGLSFIPLSVEKAMLATNSPIPTNLGARSGPNLGIDEALATLTETLTGPHRWVTLVGTGGIGKTHLAQEAGRRLAEQGVFRGGVWFYDASADRDLAGLTNGLARCLKIAPPKWTHPMEVLNRFASPLIARPRTLVIVDNLEQIATEAKEALAIWFRLLPSFSWLATSRTVLGGQSEQVVPIAPIPPEPCMALYQSIAGAPEEEAQVRQVLSTLDGLPLAVHCLASQVLTLGESEALASWPDSPARHPGGTLHGVFQWSWDLLTDDERSALQQLAAFDASLSLEAIEGIVVVEDAFVEDLVQALLDKSMLVTRTAEQFTTLIPVREFVRQQPFADYEGLMERHSRWFATWSQHIQGRLDDLADTTATGEILRNGRHLIQALSRFADSHDPLAVKMLITIPMLHDRDADAVLQQLCQHLWDHDLLSPHDQINVAIRMAGTSIRRGALDAMSQWLDEVEARIDEHTPAIQKARFAITKMRLLTATDRLNEVKAVYAAAINEPNLPTIYQYMLTRNRARIAHGQERMDWLTRADQILGDNWGAQKVEVCLYQGAFLVERGQVEKGRRFLEPAEFHALRIRHPLALRIIRLFLASLDALEGQWTAAHTRMDKLYGTAATSTSVPIHIRVCLTSCAIALMENKAEAFQRWHQKMRGFIDQLEPSPANAQALAFAALVQLQNGERAEGRRYWETLVPDLMTHWAVDEDFCEAVWTHFETAFFSERTDELEAARNFADMPPPYQADKTCFFLYLFWLRSLLQGR